ncbi:uncharacterized protein CCOS01_04853 [Colletotrichum costaricense]|uniref:Chitin-binding type-1 domain-containing protein n=1 Tax=Colletotrichum costaricense TaxID=1209916 RepID=A0AAI9Z3L1_9PEZI|nr:uncharacterized protein CCOS01_04853 [Colletotrichum costaricense]KAK1532870.1 hypothetical protein CCOS01_04853 [Colletotrichum costaricense]
MKAAIFCWLLPAFVTSQSVTATTATLSPWQTGEVTPDGTCGGTTGFVCSPVWGACCSKDGKCGRSAAFCGDGCQPAAGNCNAPAPAPAPPSGPGSISPDGSCGGANQYNCTTSPFGDCCSSSGYCGTTLGHCGSGCQDLFGTCGATTNISSDGQCGSNGKTCLGSTFGDCCSSGGYCGTSSDHCDAGCNAAFGTCSNADSGSISTDGTCGKNGKTCKGSKFGDCCSSGGFCGTSKDHCQAGCQSQFGTCGAEDNVSTDGTCGTNGKTCKGSSFGDCCSSTGFCGKSTAHCDAGCNAAFGTCNEAASGISADGQCGKNGKTCKGSAFGDCCSSGGYCGKSSDHCDAGCNASFGTCNTAAGSISTDGTCGKNGKTCKGSAFGDCCSSGGFCGKSSDHCDAGCNPSFGTCNEGASSISTDGNCGSKNGKTCKGSTFGDCCSSNGYCGKSTDHCRNGCQLSYGLCTGISSDAVCGTKNGKTCAGSGLGNCCSSGGYCGSTGAHCGQGCQKDSSSGCLTANIPSVDGTCGSGKGGFTCAGGPFDGQCCSSSGFCGTSSSHCGTGCQPGSGRCT